MVLSLFDMVSQIQVGKHYFALVKSPLARATKKLDAKRLPKKSHETINQNMNLIKAKWQAKKEEAKDTKESNRKDERRKEAEIKEEGIIEIIDEFNNVDNGSIDITLGDFKHKSDNYSAFVHSMQYQQLLDQYRRFLEAYLKDTNNVAMPQYSYENNNGSKGREFKWGEEVATYHEIKDTIRKVKMNLLLGGWHNPVSWQAVQDYKFWKYVSKFNKVMAEVIEAGVGSGG